MSSIMVAVDGSAHSVKVARTAIKHAGSYKTRPELHLIYVHLPLPTMGGLIKPIGHDAIQRYYREEGEDALRRAKRMFERAGLQCNTHILVGPIAQSIAREAKKLKCELIVMGTHGMGAISGTLLGSVAAKTVHLAHCPVVLVRD